MRALIFSLLLVSVSAVSAPGTVTFVAPTFRVGDVIPLPQSEILHYKLRCYKDATQVINDTVPNNVTSWSIDLPPGVYGCHMVTVDTSNQYSAISNKAVFEIVLPAPNPPVIQ